MKTFPISSRSCGIRLDCGRKPPTTKGLFKWSGAFLTGFMIVIALWGIGLCSEPDPGSRVIQGQGAILIPDLKGRATDKDSLYSLTLILKKTDKKNNCLSYVQIMYPYRGKEGPKEVPVQILLKKATASSPTASSKEIPKGKATANSPIGRSLVEINAEIVNEDEFRVFKGKLPKEKRNEVEGFSPGKHWISFIMEDPGNPGSCMEVIILHQGFEPKGK